MFTITTHSSLQTPFILHEESGFVTDTPTMRVCLIHFDSHYYQDALFEILSVPFAPMLQSAMIKRRAEYLAGRYAAQTLLRQQGCHDAVTMEQSRAPKWPAGWCGSISHTDNHAIAVLTRQSAKLTPGVDIERRCPTVMNETAHIFTNLQERSLLYHCNTEYETALLITFSAKESLYKALYPQVLQMFSFNAATICELDVQRQRFCLQLTQTLSPSLPAGFELSGQYLFQGDDIITLIT